MRKIAANYIFLPGYPLVKNGYVVLSAGKIEAVVTGKGEIEETERLEFYGGMIIANHLPAEMLKEWCGKEIIPLLTDYYASHPVCTGIALLTGADLRRLLFTATTRIQSI